MYDIIFNSNYMPSEYLFVAVKNGYTCTPRWLIETMYDVSIKILENIYVMFSIMDTKKLLTNTN